VDLTVILPTRNECKNIPQITSQILSSQVLPQSTRIVVVDDNSKDGTREILLKLASNQNRLDAILRDGEGNLPSAIWAGISASSSDYVAWMDADLSMPVDCLEKMWKEIEGGSSIVIGSRFLPGGGFKGSNGYNSNVIKLRRNLKKSKDSLAAVILSRIFNRLLRYISFSRITDVTSGFIIINKAYVNENWFNCKYGEYFLNIVHTIKVERLPFKEVPFVNLPRVFGESKTGSTVFQLVRRGIPYITLALRIQFNQINKNRLQND
jgi:dolichol-phosphate mannosyltransferase